MYLVLVWDVSRTGGVGGLRFNWEEDSGWSYALHRVFAAPDDVAAVAEHLVCNWRTPTGEYGAEWDQATHVRATIERFRATVKKPGGLWAGAE
ncbi:hypothetical protein AB0C70_42615 [Streptomyces sp. NPDC048564]|uniref:hypothetical protein n=1 Tax=Streptomyces sp. NPDC048564 TaxID=3155760 RepID=UPI0034173231